MKERVRRLAGPALHWSRRATGVAVAALVLSTGLLVPAGPAAADGIRDQQWYLSALGVPAAHGVSQGEGVTVAVLDSGVNPDQPDLTGSVVDGIDAYPNRGNGKRDTYGHGTGMAAIIAGHGHGPGNGSGMLGIAPRARIMPIRLGTDASTGYGVGYEGATVARGIDFAVQHGAKVISASLTLDLSETLRQAILRALDQDVVIVAATGNANERGQSAMGAPAFYAGVVAVGGVDRAGNHASFSVPAQNGRQLSVCAPAVDGVNANPDGTYATGKSGTSMSAAIVAGVAALIRSRYPDMPAYEVAHRLEASAVDKGAPGVDDLYGYGNLNLNAALTANIPAGPSPSPWIKRSATPSSPRPEPSASPSQATAEPPDGGSGVLVATVVVGAAILLLVLAAAWFLVHRRRRAGS